MSEQPEIRVEDIQRTFAVSPLEPEISEAMLFSYAAGRADPIDAEIIESAFEFDPELRATVTAMREEMAAIQEPLPSIAAPKPAKVKRSWWPLVALLNAGLAAVAGVGFYLVDQERVRLHSEMNSAVADARSAQGALTQRQQDFDQRTKQLEARLQHLQRQAGSSRAELIRLKQELKERDKTRAVLASNVPPAGKRAGPGYVRLGASVARVLPKSDAVAKAIDGELLVASVEAQEPVLRGSQNLAVSMRPNAAAVVTPVELSWSGGTPPFRVEVYFGEQLVWAGSSEGPKVQPQRLAPGSAYAWRVRSGVSSSRFATFRVLSVEEQAEAAKIRAGSNPLDKGVGFARLGLLDAAQEQFRLLLESDPALAKKLLAQLQQKHR